MKKAIIITGGSGALGKELVNYYLDKRCFVVTTTRNKKKAENIFRKTNLLEIIEIDFLADKSEIVFVDELIRRNITPLNIIFSARDLKSLKINDDGSSSTKNLLNEFKMAVTIPYQIIINIKNRKLDKELKSLIFISSIYGIVAPNSNLYSNFTQSSPIQYGIAKSAQIHLAKELSVRLASSNVRVNSISYGGFKGRTDDEFQKKYNSLNPQNRMLDLKEVVGPVDFLISEASKGMTGHNLIYDSGWTVW